jgi:glycogen debranching enzyme
VDSPRRRPLKELAAVESWSDLWYSKEQKHFELSGNSSFFCEGEEELETVFRWLKHNAIWLEMDADTLGYGFAAGIEDYPWFFGCDSEFSILGLNAVGRYDLSKSMLRLLAKASERTNGTGQIIHEMSTNGAVFNHGNLNETPQFVTAVLGHLPLERGSSNFLAEMYPLMLKSMRWLEAQDLDGNGIPNGYGMMEIHGMNGEMIDVASYSVQGWEALGQTALAMDNDAGTAEWAGKNAARLSKYINEYYWIESAGAYADVRGRPSDKPFHSLEDAIERAKGTG